MSETLKAWLEADFDRGWDSEVLSQPTILIKVGPEEKEFHVHKALLTYHSGYFAGALGSSVFKEAEDGIVTLADVDPKAFQLFTQFLYARLGGNGNMLRQLGAHVHHSSGALINAYILADRLLVPAFTAVILGLAFEIYAEAPPPFEHVALAFDNLPSDDSFLTLIVDSRAANWQIIESNSKDEDPIEGLPKEFLYRVVERMHEVSTTSNLKRAIRGKTFYCGKQSNDGSSSNANMPASKQKDSQVIRIPSMLSRPVHDSRVVPTMPFYYCSI